MNVEIHYQLIMEDRRKAEEGREEVIRSDKGVSQCRVVQGTKAGR